MKHLIVTIALMLVASLAIAQEHLFVLVDVSKSVSKSELQKAKDVLENVLTGTQLSHGAAVTQGKEQDLPLFALQQYDKLAIATFGDLNTSLQITPNPTTIQNIGADVETVLNSITWRPTDNTTYIVLAKARIAAYAKKQGIDQYRLCIISDNVQDDYGPNGMPNYPNNSTQELVEEYNTSTNPVNEAGYTRIKFSRQSLFALSFSPKVDISQYYPPGIPKPNTPTPIPIDTVKYPTITVISPRRVKKGKEYEHGAATLNVNWKCTDCPKGIKYNVAVSQYEGGKHKEVRKNVSANTVSLELPDGKFKIRIYAANHANTRSDYTHVSVSTGGFGGVLFFLALLGAGGAGYYFWNKNRGATATTPTQKEEDIFSKADQQDTSNNDDYF